MLRAAFGTQPGGVDLPTFPPFALLDPALGLTSVIPDMDPTRPAHADPRKLHAAIERFGVTQLFGSPALMGVLATHGAVLPRSEEHTSELQSLMRISYAVFCLKKKNNTKKISEKNNSRQQR